MTLFWRILYNLLFIPFFWSLLIIASLFNSKVRRGIRGRKNLFFELEKKLSKIPKNGKRIWIHSSSMGEFEQAKPLIFLLKERIPEIKIIVSFFSPSGYDNNLNYNLADLVTYIPFDSLARSKKFVNAISPDLSIFMRYDIWPNHLWELNDKKIPAFLVDATMRSHSKRALPVIKSFHRSLFKHLNGILTVSENDATEFKNFGCKPPSVQVVGDTRYDQVYLKSIKAKEKILIPKKVIEDKKTFIVGSSWGSDEDHIIPAFVKLQKYEPDLIMILVPHEPTETNLDRIESELRNKTSFIRFSQLMNYKSEKVIIIDCIGLLVSLYTYGDVAYVGGGFGEGIHNTLEPATYNIPVIFGPKNRNSQEAQILLKLGGAFVIKNKIDLYIHLRRFFSDDSLRKNAGLIAGNLVKNNLGAADKIYNYFKNYI